MQALRKTKFVSAHFPPERVTNARALDFASTSDPGNQFIARAHRVDDGRGARPHPSSGVPANQFNQVDWLELSRRAFNERFFAGFGEVVLRDTR